MKTKTKNNAFMFIIGLMMIYIIHRLRQPRVIHVEKQVPVHIPVRTPAEIPVSREYRRPPIKQYKPRRVQQMGILLGPDDETLPIYGKEVRGRRDRYHYYTTTPGDQIYSLPITHDNRDCMDDIGCQEFYGNETVSVLGQTGSFQTKLYRTDDFF